MQFTDSHIHLQDYKEENEQKIINNMKSLGFSKIICASSHPDDWSKIAQIASLNPDFVVPAFGVHPWYVADTAVNWKDELNNYLAKFPNAIVGECGVDNLKAGNNELQEQTFTYHVDIAKSLKRPICIHALKANNQIEAALHKMPDKFMLHAFGGSIEFLQNILKHGGYISLCASARKQKNHVDIIKTTPKEKLLIESYLSEKSVF